MPVSVDDPCQAARDPALPTLVDALQPDIAQQQLVKRLARVPALRGRLTLEAIEVIRHKPSRRCVVRYQLRHQCAGREEQQLVLLGKIRSKRFGKSGYRRLKQLWELGFSDSSPDGISVPETVGTIPRFQMWLQREVPGRVATELLVGPEGPALARRVAEAARKLHCCGLPLESEHTLVGELRVLRTCLPEVGQAMPDLADRVERLLRQCERLVQGRCEAPSAPIHRDYYADQLIVDGDRLYMLDFDLCCRGNPALDIGNFAGHLSEQSRRELGDPAALRGVEHALIERFLELAPPVAPVEVEIYHALTLVRHVFLSTRFVERRPHTPQILTQCEEWLVRLLDRSGELPMSRSPSPAPLPLPDRQLEAAPDRAPRG